MLASPHCFKAFLIISSLSLCVSVAMAFLGFVSSLGPLNPGTHRSQCLKLRLYVIQHFNKTPYGYRPHKINITNRLCDLKNIGLEYQYVTIRSFWDSLKIPTVKNGCGHFPMLWSQNKHHQSIFWPQKHRFRVPIYHNP